MGERERECVAHRPGWEGVFGVLLSVFPQLRCIIGSRRIFWTTCSVASLGSFSVSGVLLPEM